MSEERAAWREKLEPMIQGWLDRMEAEGIADARDLYAEARRLAAEECAPEGGRVRAAPPWTPPCALLIGLITPPVGLNLFAIQSVDPELRLATVIRGVLPFVAADVVRLALLILVPGLALWLPSLMMP